MGEIQFTYQAYIGIKNIMTTETINANDVINFTFTPNAAEKIQEIAKRENKENYGFRVRVMPGGCSGFQYDFYFEEKSESEDIVVENNGVKVFLDSMSAQMLAGSTLDYVDSLQGAGFKIDNPNATSSCGCGKSFS